MTKEAIAERKELARREELTIHAVQRPGWFISPASFHPRGKWCDDSAYTLPPTAEELVAAVLPNFVEGIGERLTCARDRARGPVSAWEARMQETAARV